MHEKIELRTVMPNPYGGRNSRMKSEDEQLEELTLKLFEIDVKSTFLNALFQGWKCLKTSITLLENLQNPAG